LRRIILSALFVLAVAVAVAETYLHGVESLRGREKATVVALP